LIPPIRSAKKSPSCRNRLPAKTHSCSKGAGLSLGNSLLIEEENRQKAGESDEAAVGYHVEAVEPRNAHFLCGQFSRPFEGKFVPKKYENHKMADSEPHRHKGLFFGAFDGTGIM
jgi:hypothetical protein